MIEVFHTDTYVASSGEATIKVQRYTDSGFGPHVIWRITLQRDSDDFRQILESRRLTPPSMRTIARYINKY